MIKVLNADNSFNKEAAEFLKEKILDLWPDLEDHILIPFTRATNTLVLEIYSKKTFLGSTLYEMSIEPSTRDIIEWRDPDKLVEDEIPF